MSANLSVKNKRDILLVTLLFIILGGIFILFRLFAFQGEAAIANVYYGNSSEPIVSIDFVNYRVIKNYDQQVPSTYDQVYPIIDETARTITLLGDYELSGTRQIVVIQYHYGNKSVQIIQEQSPNKICSREGVSTGWPLICLPNRVRVEFETTAEDFTV
ncbi:MAG: NusG domain II-containing protein [Firmicutes bacterium]|nr:NusG domain II-containing protein [Bacillota bacterium]